MTNNKLKDEQIAQLLGFACMVIGDRFATVDELSAAKAIRALAVELQERRKADSEPVAWGLFDFSNGYLYNFCSSENRAEQYRNQVHQSSDSLTLEIKPLYASPQPAPDREKVRREHAEWADMQFLLWDAQRRAGITDEQITQALIEKLAVNKQREWPEPKEGEPRLHIKEQPAPVGPVTDAMVYAFHHALTDGPLGDDDVEEIKTGLRAAFATVTINQPAPVVLTFEEWCKRTGQKPQGWVCDAMKEAYEGANSPVIPDGYVMVPMRLTAENGAKGVLSGEFSETKFVNCPECFGDDECETCDGSGRIEIKVPVSWTTIKDIWIKGVEHFAAAPQENI